MPPERSPGFRFKEGKLYAFTGESVLLLESWPALRAVRKANGRPWQEFTPAFRVVQPYRPRKVRPAPPSPQLELALGVVPMVRRASTVAVQRRRAFNQFRFSLPRPVAARAEKFQSRQWVLLRLFHAREQTLELAALNPALCFALANHRSFTEAAACDTEEEVAKISERRQREIAGWLGFPATDAAVRILAKLAPESASVEMLRPLRAALTNPDVVKALGHLPRLNAGVIALVLDPRLHIATTPKLLAEVGEMRERYRAITADLLGDTLCMLRSVHPNHACPKIQSLTRLREMHDEISVQYLREHDDEIRNVRLPRPPLPATAQIVPIRTVVELIEEGRQQNNCVATYAERVQRGGIFIYRVLSPERATLSIVKNPDGDWEISELKRQSNFPVSVATQHFVESWLDEYALSA